MAHTERDRRYVREQGEEGGRFGSTLQTFIISLGWIGPEPLRLVLAPSKLVSGIFLLLPPSFSSPPFPVPAYCPEDSSLPLASLLDLLPAVKTLMPTPPCSSYPASCPKDSLEVTQLLNDESKLEVLTLPLPSLFLLLPPPLKSPSSFLLPPSSFFLLPSSSFLP
jgi:hypothetical protein